MLVNSFRGISAEIFNNGIFTEAQLSLRSQAPNFNFFLHRSNYIEYDWYNPSLNNQLINSLSFKFGSPQMGNIRGTIRNIRQLYLF